MILFVVWEWYSCSTQMIKSTRKSTLVPAPESPFRGCTPHLFQSRIFPCSDFLLYEIQNVDFGNMHGKYKKYMKCLLFHPNLWTAHSTFPSIVSSPIRLCNVLSSWFVLQMLFLKIKTAGKHWLGRSSLPVRKRREVLHEGPQCWYQAGFKSKKYNSKLREIHFSKREEILHRGAAALVSSGGSWWVINHSQNYLQPKVVKCLKAGLAEKYKVRGKWGLAWGLKESTHGKECFDVNTRELESVDLSRQNISVGCLFSEHSHVFPMPFPKHIAILWYIDYT